MCDRCTFLTYKSHHKPLRTSQSPCLSPIPHSRISMTMHGLTTYLTVAYP